MEAHGRVSRAVVTCRRSREAAACQAQRLRTACSSAGVNTLPHGDCGEREVLIALIGTNGQPMWTRLYLRAGYAVMTTLGLPCHPLHGHDPAGHQNDAVRIGQRVPKHLTGSAVFRHVEVHHA
jgi:hypothetical protein